MYPYTSAPGVYRCPSDESTIKATQLPRLRSYSLDGGLRSKILGGYDFDFHLAEANKYSAIRIPSTAEAFVFGDEHSESIDDGAWLVAEADNRDMATRDGGFDIIDTEAWVDFPSDRHSQGANFSFADGHVQFHHWKAPKIFKHHWQRAQMGPDHDDLRYLQSMFPRLH